MNKKVIIVSVVAGILIGLYASKIPVVGPYLLKVGPKTPAAS